ncbi:hypothetical protein B5F34_06530 [Mediterranea sp. An20]|nr:hypothetical protein B5F34_06530 [Mediterranea sp. An20]
MLGIAGLAFAACSNEEEFGTNQTFEGNGVVSVRIATPTLTRNAGAATSGADGGTVAITGDITVTLTGIGADNAPYNKSITIDADDLTSATELKFWNIAVPEKLTASIHGGQADYSDVEIASIEEGAPNPLQVVATSIPAYGETTKFTRTTDIEHPTIGSDIEAGAVEGDQNKNYEMYTATVNMAIPVARLEVSNIYHVTHTGTGNPADNCIYKTLTLDGAYLDGYCLNGSVYDEETGTFPDSEGTGDEYSIDGINGSGTESLLKDIIDPSINFLTTTEIAPAAGPYTYNFFANGTNPVFKLYFKTAEEVDDYQGDIKAPRYAMITEYKDMEGDPVVFENGHIYRIVGAELSDKNIIGDEDGNTLYGVSVTVIEATWTIVDIDASWAEQ